MKVLAILALFVVGASCMISLADNSLNADWHAFKAEHSKLYQDLDEELSRYISQI
jgi:hypothetical protein